MLTIELESIAVHFWSTTVWNDDDTELIPAWKYWLETGYQSIAYLDLGEAIKAAKQEVIETNEHYKCLVMYPHNIDSSWIDTSDCEF
ncbi:MAG: hypothetical protein WBV73_08595 [Phormidium sp.]